MAVVKMCGGKIHTAVDNGRYLLRFEGDIRLTLCAALDDYIESMFADPAFESVSVDLSPATGMDSTSLGTLAKLALKAEKDYEMQPLLFTTNPDITSVLESMGLDEVFSVQQTTSDMESCDGLLSSISANSESVDESDVRKRVVEAHRILMSLNAENRLAFKDLMQSLN